MVNVEPQKVITALAGRIAQLEIERTAQAVAIEQLEGDLQQALEMLERAQARTEVVGD